MEQIPFDLRDILREVSTLIEVQAVERGIVFDYKPEEGQHWNLIGSPLHLRQILLNIAGNSVKYNRVNGNLKLFCREVSSSKEYAMFEFTCADTGKGMSEEFQQHMFEPFSQEENGARTNLGGTGLGLSIVAQVCHTHHAGFELYSRNGFTTAGITFPILAMDDMRNTI